MNLLSKGSCCLSLVLLGRGPVVRLCCGMHRVQPWLAANCHWIACYAILLWVVCCVECLGCLSLCIAKLPQRSSFHFEDKIYTTKLVFF